MAKVVNLNQYRKRKGRAEKDSRSAENRVKFGRTGAEKKNDTDNRDRESADLSGKAMTGEEMTGETAGKTPDENKNGDGDGSTPDED